MICQMEWEKCELEKPHHIVEMLENGHAGTSIRPVRCNSYSFYNWKDFLSQFFQGVMLGIMQFHFLEFVKPGIVRWKRAHQDEWQTHSALLPNITIDVIKSPQRNGFQPLSKFKLRQSPMPDARVKDIDAICKEIPEIVGSKNNFLKFSQWWLFWNVRKSKTKDNLVITNASN